MTDTSAVDTNAQPPADAEKTTEQEPSLDELLNEFNEPAQPTAPAPEAKPETAQPEGLDDVVKWVNEQRQDAVQKQTQADIDAAVKAVGDALDTPLPDRMIRNFIVGEVEFDQRMLNAWAQRGQNRTAWDGVVKGLARELQSTLSEAPDTDLTAARDAARAAVRGQQKPTETTPDINAMSTQEFEAHSKQMFAENARKRGLT